MIRTYQFACYLPRTMADALNMESARIYNAVMVEHWRIYRKHGVWLRKFTGSKLNDFYDRATPKLLHSNAIDNAQHAFYKACKTAREQRKAGEQVRYPYKRRRFRTTLFGAKCVYRVEDGVLWLSLAKGRDRLPVRIPANLSDLLKEQIKEMRLVYNRATRRYSWHMVVDDGIDPAPSESKRVAAIDMGEIHPVAITDGVHACVISCRELRSLTRLRNKRLGFFTQALGSTTAEGKQYVRGSRRWHKLNRRKRWFLAKMQESKRGMCHKIARTTVEWAVEHDVGIIVIGDVRDIADGKRLHRNAQQKVSQWSHGIIRKYIAEKAAAYGIEVIDDVPERYTSQTCPLCGNRHKPKGRLYECPNCGGKFHRDIVGAANIGSVYEYGEPGHWTAPEPMYRYPVDVQGKRSPQNQGHVARESENLVTVG